MPTEPGSQADAIALALVHRGWDHLKLQRPLAAWASWQQALRVKPGDPAATQALERLEQSAVLPAVATAAYRFRAPAGDARRARWDAAFRSRDMGELAVAAEVFGTLAAEDADDAAARYNRALCLAWLGRNAEAVMALDSFVQRTVATDFEAAVGAWVLAEVLRHGAGAKHLADDFTASAAIPWPEATADPAALDEPGLIRLHPVSIDPQTGGAADPQTAAYEWLDRPMPEPSAVRSADDLPHALATIVRRPGVLEVSTPRLLDRNEIERRLARASGVEELGLDWALTPLPLRFLDAAVWTFRFPPGMDDDERHRLTREAIERYYEDVWVHQPRIGLGPDPGSPTRVVPQTLDSRRRHPGGSAPASTPLEAGRRAAAGDAVARARLEAVIRLREELAGRPPMAALASGYPFDRLRRRLGLDPHEEASIDPADLSCAGAGELERLDSATLDTPALAEAFRSAAALRLDEAAARFARELVDREPTALGRDGPPGLLAHLTWDAWQRGDVEGALDWLARAERAGHDPAALAGSREELQRTIADPSAAAVQYETAVAWRPDAVRRLRAAAEVHRRAGRDELARRLDELAGRANGSEEAP